MSEYTDLFNLYKEQLHIILSRGNKIIEGLKISRDSENKVFNDLEKSILEGERILKQMELDLNLSFGISNSSKSLAQNKNDKNKKSIYLDGKIKIDDLRKKFKFEKEFSSNKLKKQELLIEVKNQNKFKLDNTFSSSPLLQSENEMVIINLADRSNEKLQKIKRIGIETSSQSENIMRDLSSQTENLRDINSKVNSLNDNVDNSSNILRRIISTNNRNKKILGVFSMAMIFMFVFIVYSKFS